MEDGTNIIRKIQAFVIKHTQLNKYFTNKPHRMKKERQLLRDYRVNMIRQIGYLVIKFADNLTILTRDEELETLDSFINTDFDNKRNDYDYCKKDYDLCFAVSHMYELKYEKIQKKREFNEQEIWICFVGFGIGSEDRGHINSNFNRPVLIVKYISENTFIGVPLSHVYKDWCGYIAMKHNKDNKHISALDTSLYDLPTLQQMANNYEISSAIIVDARKYDQRRLIHKTKIKIDDDAFSQIKNAIAQLYK